MTPAKQSKPTEIANSARLHWGRINAVCRVDGPGYVEPEFVDGIEIHIHVGPEIVVHWSEGGPYCQSRTPPGRTAILRDRPYSKRVWENEARYLRITIPKEEVEADEDLSAAVEPGHWVMPDNPYHGFGHLLFEQIRSPAYSGDLVVETVVGSILANSQTPSAKVHNLSPGQLKSVIEFLIETEDEAVRVRELAKQAGMSQFAFSRAFKEATGYSPYQYALAFRIDRAKAMLANNQSPGIAIAMAAGFHDESHFSRTFKRVVGMTPAEWRNRRAR